MALMKRQNCINCIFSSWYDNFKAATFKSKIINLPLNFVTYLTSDGIILPDPNPIKYANELEGYSDDDEDDDWNNASSVSAPSTPNFPHLKQEVEEAIQDLGGVVFPKLNWSSPKDASWISHNATLKCSSFNDVCLLLKSSDFIMNDLTNAYKFCEDRTPQPNDQFELVLREFVSIVPGMEFRCFVKHNKLVGVTQRHVTTCFDYLFKEKTSILEGITNFFNSKIKGRFGDTNYVCDIYKDTRNRFRIIDFNPFGKITDSMLFSWEELHELDPAVVDTSHEDFFRLVTESNNIQPSPYMRYAMPKDVVELACGEDMNKMIDFMNVRNLISRPGDDETEKE